MKDSFSYGALHLEEKTICGQSLHHPSLKKTYEHDEKLKNTMIKLLCSDIAFDCSLKISRCNVLGQSINLLGI